MGSLYGDEHRALQDALNTRSKAELLDAKTRRTQIDDRDKAFIESRSFFFLSTVNASGHPTVSHKGGPPGFVQVVDPSTIVFPSYDGNGMFLSMGNIADNGRIGMLFMDFDDPRRLRVHANATVTVSSDEPMLTSYADADFVVRAVVIERFGNCGRYIGDPTSAPAPRD